MSKIQLHDKYFKPYISSQEIAAAVAHLANQIHQDLKNEEPIFIGVLNGAFMFIADFVRLYPEKCQVSFVKLASYEGDKTTGSVKQLIGLNEEIEGKTIVILEDIVDTGNTLQEIYEIFKDKNIKQLKTGTLFFKPEVFKKDLSIDYIGLSIPNKFIVGYGLDYDGLGRQYPDVYQVTEN